MKTFSQQILTNICTEDDGFFSPAKLKTYTIYDDERDKKIKKFDNYTIFATMIFLIVLIINLWNLIHVSNCWRKYFLSKQNFN